VIFCDLLFSGEPGTDCIYKSGSSNVTQPFHAEPERRSPRLRPAEFIPIVLRCRDGHRVPGRLQCISLTGGLMSATSLLAPGSLVKLMFVTPKGPVAGTAEMLHPVSWTEQPFRFTAMAKPDQHRLGAMIQPAAASGASPK